MIAAAAATASVAAAENEPAADGVSVASAPVDETGRAAADNSNSAVDQLAGPSPAEVGEWIRQLDDPRYRVREEASQKLLGGGLPVLDPLLAAANSEQLEPADRATWLLQRLSESKDTSTALAALERLVQVRDRPTIVEEAESALAQLSVQVAQQKLLPLGGEVSIRREHIDPLRVATVLHIRLKAEWQGRADDLLPLVKLPRQSYYRLEGQPVDDEMVRLFVATDRLEYLQLFDTAVTPVGVDAVKDRHPDATVYVRNKALMGIGAENHVDGALVHTVQMGSGAERAGIVPGDVIKSIDGHQLKDFDRLTARVGQYPPGAKVIVEIIRAGETISREVTLGSWANVP